MLLQIQKVSKNYKDTQAVKNVSFDLKKGEILAIVGESGSGKTTLLKLIAGLLPTDKGDIFLNDTPIIPPLGRLVAGNPDIKMVFQQNQLFPKHTIAENIAYPIRHYSKEEQQKRVKKLLALCRLQKVAHKLPSELSGGQVQRISLAVALADEPLVLLLDEPFSHLDELLKREIKQDLWQIVEKLGITLIFVTHELKDAFSLAHQVAVMHKGKILQIAPTNEFILHSKHHYTLQLLKSVLPSIRLASNETHILAQLEKGMENFKSYLVEKKQEQAQYVFMGTSVLDDTFLKENNSFQAYASSHIIVFANKIAVSQSKIMEAGISFAIESGKEGMEKQVNYFTNFLFQQVIKTF